MAAADRPSGRAATDGHGRLLLRRALARLQHVPPSTAFTLRLPIAVGLAIWIGHLPGLATNEPQWILITVLLVAQPMAGGSLLKGLLRGVGTLAAAGTAILLFGAFAQDPPWLLAGLLLVQTIGAYGFTGPRYQYAWFVWAFTTAIIIGSALAGAEEVEILAFQRAGMVGIGLLVVFVVDSILWPTRSEARLRGSLAGRAGELGAALRARLEVIGGSREEAAEAPAASPLATQLQLAEAASMELGVPRARLETLSRVALLLERLASRERVLRQPLAGPPEGSAGLAAAFVSLSRSLEASLIKAAAALGSERPPARRADELERDLASLHAELEREPAGTRGLAGPVADIEGVVALVRRLEETLSGLAPAASTPEATPSPTPFQLDPFRLQVALRTAVAACGALLAVMVLGWDMNAAVAPVAFMLAATPTRGAAAQTLLVLLGTLLFGWLIADLAIVFVTPDLGRMPLALAVPFAVTGGLAWLSMKHPMLALLPSIGGLVAIVPVFTGSAAPTDVYGPYSLMCYLALGVGIGWASTRLLWPATAATLFRERAATQLEICLEALRLPVDKDGSEWRRRAATVLGAYSKQTTLLRKLHAQARLEPVERGLDEPHRLEWVALAQDLFDAALASERSVAPMGPGPDAWVALHEALGRADETLVSSIQATAEALRGATSVPSPTLREARDLVEARVAELRDAIAAGWTPEPQQRANVLRRIESLRRLCARELAIEGWWSETLGTDDAE